MQFEGDRVATLGRGRYGEVTCYRIGEACMRKYETEIPFVAVKSITSGNTSLRALELLKKEVGLLHSISGSCCNVAKLLDCCEIKLPATDEAADHDSTDYDNEGSISLSTKFYFVMRPYLGGSLHCHLSQRYRGGLPVQTARIYLSELVAALQYLQTEIHTQCSDSEIIQHCVCVHRDIKASNCLLDHEGRLVLCDFGSAKLLSATPPPHHHSSARIPKSLDNHHDTSCCNPASAPNTRGIVGGSGIHYPARAYSIVGTAHAMSPETVTGTLGCDAAADCWALGVLVLELLSGATPPWNRAVLDNSTLEHLVAGATSAAQSAATGGSGEGGSAGRGGSSRNWPDEYARVLAQKAVFVDQHLRDAADPLGALPHETVATSASAIVARNYIDPITKDALGVWYVQMPLNNTRNITRYVTNTAQAAQIPHAGQVEQYAHAMVQAWEATHGMGVGPAPADIAAVVCEDKGDADGSCVANVGAKRGGALQSNIPSIPSRAASVTFPDVHQAAGDKERISKQNKSTVTGSAINGAAVFSGGSSSGPGRMQLSRSTYSGGGVGVVAATGGGGGGSACEELLTFLAVDLAMRLLAVSPSHRCTIAQARTHPFFSTPTPASTPTSTPTCSIPAAAVAAAGSVVLKEGGISAVDWEAVRAGRSAVADAHFDRRMGCMDLLPELDKTTGTGTALRGAGGSQHRQTQGTIIGAVAGVARLGGNGDLTDELTAEQQALFEGF